MDWLDTIDLKRSKLTFSGHGSVLTDEPTRMDDEGPCRSWSTSVVCGEVSTLYLPMVCRPLVCSS